jgi:biopolymer transport protein ExbB
VKPFRSFSLWLLPVLLMAFAPSAANAWWEKDWSFRKQITIDTTSKGANIAQTVGRMPVLVRLHSGNFSFGDAQENGTDLRFVAADDKTPLAYHIESFDPLLGVATIWVDVPDVAGGTAKNIWLYYGNKKATPSTDAAGTFDSDYTLIYHFDDAAGASPKDKTAYGNNAQTAPAGYDDGAIIGKGARFSGTTTITTPASPSLAIQPGGQFTFSAWIKSTPVTGPVAIFSRRQGGVVIIVGLDQGIPFVDVGQDTAPQRIAAAQPIVKDQWTHIAATADGKIVTLYVNGRSVGTVAASLPGFNSPTVLGGDVAGGAPAFANFTGEMDEARLSKIARPEALILADAISQSGDSKLVVYGQDEKQSGFSFGYFGIIVQSVTIDAWVVISILGVMAMLSWFVMWTKASYINAVDRANNAFIELFRDQSGDPLSLDETKLSAKDKRRVGASSIYRLYRAGAQEIRRRASSGGRLVLNAEAIEVIRAVVDATLVRENQRLARSMVLLTISISGGPFLGLLGTVVGVMITFAAIAASGDVNVNAIAPGISAALLATVAGLAVAIPALFGYNYLLIRSKNITADMQVFVDEFVTRLSEVYAGRDFARAAE